MTRKRDGPTVTGAVILGHDAVGVVALFNPQSALLGLPLDCQPTRLFDSLHDAVDHVIPWQPVPRRRWQQPTSCGFLSGTARCVPSAAHPRSELASSRAQRAPCGRSGGLRAAASHHEERPERVATPPATRQAVWPGLGVRSRGGRVGALRPRVVPMCRMGMGQGSVLLRVGSRDPGLWILPQTEQETASGLPSLPRREHPRHECPFPGRRDEIAEAGSGRLCSGPARMGVNSPPASRSLTNPDRHKQNVG